MGLVVFLQDCCHVVAGREDKDCLIGSNKMVGVGNGKQQSIGRLN